MKVNRAVRVNKGYQQTADVCKTHIPAYRIKIFKKKHMSGAHMYSQKKTCLDFQAFL